MAKDENRHIVTIKIEGESWVKALDKAFKDEVQKVEVDGFRKGKVPRDIFEKRYGKERLFIPAVDYVIEEAYAKALSESQLIPVAQPKLEIKSVDDSGVELNFTFITKPKVSIKKYKGLNIKKEEVEVTKEEIDHEIHHILERYSELKTKENGTVNNGDVAIIDFEGKKDGVPFEGGKADNYELEIGSGTFIPGFEEQLIGMHQNEEKDIKVTFPDDYPAPELKGQEVTFTVKVNEVKEKVERELDSELFEDLAMEGVNSRETLENEIRANIIAQKEMDYENQYIDNLLEAVGQNTTVDIPEEMVSEEVDRLLHRFEEQIKMQGITLDLYYQFTHSTESDLRNNLEKEAYSHVLYRLMLEEIATLEKVEISDKEAQEEATKLAEKYQMKEDEFLKMFGGIEMIKYDLEVRKVIELLKEYNK